MNAHLLRRWHLWLATQGIRSRLRVGPAARLPRPSKTPSLAVHAQRSKAACAAPACANVVHIDFGRHQ